MRMWMVDPAGMCNKHLLGEHVEIHMFVGSMNKGKNVSGFLDKRLLETSSLQSRHSALVVEMGKRGMDHKSPLPTINPYPIAWDLVTVDQNASMLELCRRCPECRKRSGSET